MKAFKIETFYQHFTVKRQSGVPFSNVNEMRVVNASLCKKCLVFRNKSSNENLRNFAPLQLLFYAKALHPLNCNGWYV